jgi:hypothetical protein
VWEDFSVCVKNYSDLKNNTQIKMRQKNMITYIDKIALNALKKRIMAVDAGILPYGNKWKSILRSVRDSRGNLKDGRSIAEILEKKWGRTSNNRWQKEKAFVEKGPYFEYKDIALKPYLNMPKPSKDVNRAALDEMHKVISTSASPEYYFLENGAMGQGFFGQAFPTNRKELLSGELYRKMLRDPEYIQTAMSTLESHTHPYLGLLGKNKRFSSVDKFLGFDGDSADDFFDDMVKQVIINKAKKETGVAIPLSLEEIRRKTPLYKVLMNSPKAQFNLLTPSSWNPDVDMRKVEQIVRRIDKMDNLDAIQRATMIFNETKHSRELFIPLNADTAVFTHLRGNKRNKIKNFDVDVETIWKKNYKQKGAFDSAGFIHNKKRYGNPYRELWNKYQKGSSQKV